MARSGTVGNTSGNQQMSDSHSASIQRRSFFGYVDLATTFALLSEDLPDLVYFLDLFGTIDDSIVSPRDLSDMRKYITLPLFL